MPRKLRLQYPDAIYHVMNRGDRHEAIFKTDQDRTLFLETLGQACAKTGWQVHAFCLMPNHFHLVIETPQPNLAAGMKWLLATYTSRFNRRHQQFGHLFSGRYKAGLQALGWSEEPLAQTPKGDPAKLKLALRLHMGTWTHLNHLLYWRTRNKTKR